MVTFKIGNREVNYFLEITADDLANSLTNIFSFYLKNICTNELI